MKGSLRRPIIVIKADVVALSLRFGGMGRTEAYRTYKQSAHSHKGDKTPQKREPRREAEIAIEPNPAAGKEEKRERDIPAKAE